MDTVNLELPDYYINRELSQLEFNFRVLRQAADPTTPLLERLKFLCISSTNLDEFFEIRVAGVKQRLERQTVAAGPDNLSPSELLSIIRDKTIQLVHDQYQLLNDELTPQLAANDIRFIRRDQWNPSQRSWLDDYFRRQVVPVLSPTSLDPARPIPKILNKSLNFIVDLDGTDVFGRPCAKAIVQAPRSLPRLIRLPGDLAETGNNDFVFLSSVIHAFADQLFAGMSIAGCYQFRVTRNSDLYVDNEEVDDLMRALEGELLASRYGAAVRLETAHDCPEHLSAFLLDHFGLEQDDLYQVDGPVNLNRLLAIYDLIDLPELKYAPFTPSLPGDLVGTNGIFDTLRQRQVLLHHPYESFAPVADFVAKAASDPDVLAIKQTLYRTGSDSPIVASLVKAARAGKEVTVIIELRARFDEADNIALANTLQEAGAHVVYGVVGYKTHCKMSLVVRREAGHLHRYVHLGTGNYHPGTARVYTDYGLLSSNRDLGEDVHQIFMQLTSLTKTKRLRQLYQSPFNLHERLLELINAEIDAAQSGSTGHIIAKVNALVEPEVIRALYRASAAGVVIDLIVRGICCLRPGIPGVSDNIRVRSIVGRFLEHSRVYYFHHAGNEQIYCASADWMDRNFFNRIEVMFPITDPRHRQRVVGDLDTYLSDNCQAWELLANGSYRRTQPGAGDKAIEAQTTLLTQLSESA